MSRDQDAGARFEAEARRSVEVESTFHLIERARAGDQEALERLFARHLKPLQRWASGRLPKWARDLADTDDLVQDTLAQTFKRIEHFEPRRVGALQAYLRQAVLNRILNELRRKGRQPPITDLDGIEVESGESPLEQAIGREAVECYEGGASAADGGRAGSDHRQGGDGLQLRGAGRGAGQTDTRRGAQDGAPGPRPAGRGDETCCRVISWSTISPTRSSTEPLSTGWLPNRALTGQRGHS